MSYSDNNAYYLGFKYPLIADVGDVLYIYTQVKVKTIEQSLRFGLESDFTAVQTQVPTINEFHPISIVKTANIENPYFLLQQRSGGFYTTGEKIYLKYPVVINLTKIYGNGYEPTKEEVDILMNVISKPFNETTNKEIVEWQEKKIRYRYSNDYSRLMKFELGALSVNGINSTEFITTTRVRTNLIRVYAGDVIELSSDDYAYDVRTFTPSMEYIGQTDYLTDATYTIEKDGFIRVAIKRIDDGDLTGLLDDIKNSFTILGYSNKAEIPNYLLGQKLEGKMLLNLGDSIAASDLYSGFISTKYSMPLFNFASGGATIAPRAGYDNEVIKQVNDAIVQGITPDYVLFNGGTNDANVLDLSLTGTITDDYDDVLDLNTFCGAFENLVKTMVNNWHYAKIIYIRAHNMDSRDDRQRVYGELALEICKKWSIPYVDIYSEGRLNSKISVMKTNYAPDGTHPNHEGIAKFYVPLIESKMNEV